MVYNGWTPPIDPIVKVRNRLINLIGDDAFAEWAETLPDIIVNDDEAYESMIRYKISEIESAQAEASAGIDHYSEQMQFTQELRHG